MLSLSASSGHKKIALLAIELLVVLFVFKLARLNDKLKTG